VSAYVQGNIPETDMYTDIWEVTSEGNKVSSEEVNALENFLLTKDWSFESNGSSKWRHHTVMTTRNHCKRTTMMKMIPKPMKEIIMALATQKKKRYRQGWTCCINTAYGSSVTTAMGR
jgi:hypothetical protein